MLYSKSVVKGGERSRTVPVNRDGRWAIDDLIAWHRERYNTLHKSRPLFPSRQGKRPQPMSRRTAHNVLKAAFEAAGLNGHLATHSLRKSFAQRLYEQSGDIFMVQELLGHANVATTQTYLGVNYASARQAVEEMAFSVDIHGTHLYGKQEGDCKRSDRNRSPFLRDKLSEAVHILRSEKEADKQAILSILAELRILIEEHLESDVNQLLGGI